MGTKPDYEELAAQVKDLQKRLASMEKVRSQKQSLDSLIGLSGQYVWEWDFVAGVKTFSREFYRLTGLDARKKKFSAKDWENLIHPDDRAEYQEAVQKGVRLEAGRFDAEYRIRPKTGEWKWVFERAVVTERGENGTPLQIQGINSDITDAVRLKNKQFNSEQFIQSVFDAIRDGVTVLSPDLTIIRTNHSQRKRFRAKRPLIGRKCHQVFQNRNTPCKLCPALRCLETKASEQNEMRFEAESDPIWSEIHAFPLFNKQKEIVNILVYSRNITDKKKQEDEVVKTRKFRAIGALAGGIAHDFNNLIYAIKGNIDLAKKDRRPRKKILKNLSEIEKACNYARELISKFILLSSGGVPRIKELCITGLIKASVQTWVQNSKITYETIFHDHTWRVKADGDQMQRILFELVKNSEEAMPDGGKIVISVANHDAAVYSPSHPSAAVGRFVRLDVWDTGPGIPEQDLPIIFDPYFSTKARGAQKGMGLGLAMVHSVVEKHNGFIDVRNRRENGAMVTIYLPADTTTH